MAVFWSACGASGGGEETPAASAVAPPGADAAGERAAFLRSVRDLERSLNAIRARHFGTVRVADVRNEGLRRVRATLDEFAQPLPGEAISAAIGVFEREANDVRVALLTYIAEEDSGQGDAALAWTACFDRDSTIRETALGMLVQRAQVDGVSHGAKLALDRALRSGDDAHAAAGAKAIDALTLLEAIPLLISAQVSTPGQGAADAGGVRAFILVGQQQTFVSGLTPVVGNATVAFQPEMSTLTTGSLLVVGDSLVTSYRTEVHESLVRLTSRVWDHSTAYLGWDTDGWRRWHREVFVPFLANRDRASLHGPSAEPPVDR